MLPLSYLAGGDFISAIIDWVAGIGEAISSAFDFFVGFLADLVYLVQLTGKMIAQIPSYFSWLPAPILGILITAVSVAVVFKIIGR